MATSAHLHDQKPSGSSQLPLDKLKVYAKTLGVQIRADSSEADLEVRIKERLAAIAELDREALLEICVWARRPVPAAATKEELVAEIVEVTGMRFEKLPDPGLYALCRLRHVDVPRQAGRGTMLKALKRAEPWGRYIRRKKRRLLGSLVSRLLPGMGPSSEPAQHGPHLSHQEHISLKQRIEEEGVVSGLSRKIRGVADDYVREKLDEIERRIDRKLDDIDRRLEQWRDREIRNRLRIIKITLIASIIVALLSFGYDRLRRQMGSSAPASSAREGQP